MPSLTPKKKSKNGYKLPGELLSSLKADPSNSKAWDELTNNVDSYQVWGVMMHLS